VRTGVCAAVTRGHGALPRDLAADQRRLLGFSPEGRPNGPSAQRLTSPAAPLPSQSWQLPHTINSPIPPKNLTRDSAAMASARRARW
jgi:hypothetical protein